MFEDQQYYNCEITLDDQSTYRVSAYWLHSMLMDNWQGWQCDAGYLRLSIDEKFDVYSGMCQNDFLGNLFDDWQPLVAPSICRRSRCTGCTADLLIGKKDVFAHQNLQDDRVIKENGFTQYNTDIDVA